MRSFPERWRAQGTPGPCVGVVLNKLMRDNDVPVVVMGSLNDAPNSVIAAILTGDPAYRLHAKSRLRRNDRGLYSAGLLQDLRSFRDVSYTYIHEGRPESLDHILVSREFYDYSKRRQWSFRRMRVINDHPDERSTPTAKKILSDHAAVSALFDHHPAKK